MRLRFASPKLPLTNPEKSMLYFSLNLSTPSGYQATSHICGTLCTIYFFGEILLRLFHVSEEENILSFKPRKPVRKDLKNSPPLVWAIDEKRLPNFLTPRDCPRVTYHIPNHFSGVFEPGLFSSSSSSHVVAIESGWFDRMKQTKLFLYEFDSNDFYLKDDIAGYYVSEKEEFPISVIVIDDLFKELFKRNIEIRILDNLINLRDIVQKTSLNWSMCRMVNAQPKK
jgi:hypothetical protein